VTPTLAQTDRPTAIEQEWSLPAKMVSAEP
jgi:hypothetical protein